MKKEAKASTNFPLFDGLIPAGFPVNLDDGESCGLNLHDYIVENDTATYFIRVKGDSMEGAGIFSNDILVVDKSLPISSGKIIVARVDGSFTVKRLLIKNHQVYLVAENPKYPPIKVNKEAGFEAFGVVTYNIHKPS